MKRSTLKCEMRESYVEDYTWDLFLFTCLKITNQKFHIPGFRSASEHGSWRRWRNCNHCGNWRGNLWRSLQNDQEKHPNAFCTRWWRDIGEPTKLQTIISHPNQDPSDSTFPAFWDKFLFLGQTNPWISLNLIYVLKKCQIKKIILNKSFF